MITKLNNFLYKINEPLYTNENISKVKQYIKTGKLPDDLNDVQMKRFIERFKYGYTLKNDKVYYKHLELVSEEDQTNKLKEIYDNPNIGLGLGITSFYKLVKDKYIGITRDDVEKFLKNQTNYQLTKETHRGINKPIIATYPNQRWAIDTVDMQFYEKQTNDGYKHILTCIDYFSKYVWAEPLKNNQAISVRDAIERIATRAHTYPKIIQSDNGSEFKGAFIDWTKEHNIDHIKTLSYSPTSNGLIENFNKQLRVLIREGVVRYDSLNWVEHLNEYENNHNNHKNTTTKFSPNEIWRQGNEEIKHNKRILPIHDDIEMKSQTNDYKVLKASERIQKQAKRNLERNKAEIFKVGEKVRVSMSALYSKYRKMIKSNKSKLLSLKYSPEIFTVYKVIKSDDFVKERYILKDSNNITVLTELKLNNPNVVRQARVFFGSDLLRVGDNTENITNQNFMNNDDDLINAVEDNNDDEEVKPVEPLRRSPRIPIPNKRYEEEDQEPEQEIIKTIPVKTKKPKPVEPIEPVEPLRRSSRTPVPNKRYV